MIELQAEQRTVKKVPFLFFIHRDRELFSTVFYCFASIEIDYRENFYILHKNLGMPDERVRFRSYC